MTNANLDRLEQNAEHPLPERYRAVMLAYPLDPKDCNARIVLCDCIEHLLALNAKLREGEFADEWSSDRLVIGSSPCGDTYFLDLTGRSSAVWMWDHETHELTVEADDLDAYGAATETRRTTARTNQRRRVNRPSPAISWSQEP
jgi:hypothetical protein